VRNDDHINKKQITTMSQVREQIQNYQGRRNSEQNQKAKMVLLCLQKAVPHRNEPSSISKNNEQLWYNCRTGDDERR